MRQNRKKDQGSRVKKAMTLYNLAWGVALPLLRLAPRTREGYSWKSLKRNSLAAADLWVHSASAGESFITWELLKNLETDTPVTVLLTTCTPQGMEILEKAANETANENLKICRAYLPFDKPSLMERAVKIIRPRITVLVELEIWPGLLYALKKNNRRVMIINGRLTSRSLKRYLKWPSLWTFLSPDRVLALSQDDKRRFERLFPAVPVDKAHNIKFDRLTPIISKTEPEKKPPLGRVIKDEANFLVLGSVRQEEEEKVEKIIKRIYRKRPETVTGLFPRHMHRLQHWGQTLTRLGIPWVSRSAIRNPVPEGTVILWDTFGELSHAYELAKAAFVGGSLAPLGGQNFLEPLASGVIPVIGPSWENFRWVGEEIVSKGLLTIAESWESAANALIRNLYTPQPREEIKNKAAGYLESRKGGSRVTCRVIRQKLTSKNKRPDHNFNHFI